MPAKRVILELGTGNDLHGGDYTKAALRAVQDALHHSSLTMLSTLKVDSKTAMFVNVARSSIGQFIRSSPANSKTFPMP